jgi:multicomponent Na+:H+ antiporter subunit D
MRFAALSIAGCPLLMGFGAKEEVFQGLTGPAYGIMMIVALGTSALMMRLVLLPSRPGSERERGAWRVPALLCVVLAGVGVVSGPYALSTWLKAAGLLAGGWLLHAIGLHRLMRVTLPDGWEKLEHVVGMTCIVLLLLIVMGGRL